jgi:hypothetical protein
MEDNITCFKFLKKELAKASHFVCCIFAFTCKENGQGSVVLVAHHP